MLVFDFKTFCLNWNVYHGVHLDGSYVAVKKLTKLDMEQGIQDFFKEIIVVSNINYRNLVKLKGC